MKIHIATDHAGLDLKNSIKNYLLQKEYFVEDHGAYEYDALIQHPLTCDASQEKSQALDKAKLDCIELGFELGTENDLAKVMVTQQVSSLAFQLTLNVRNKALSAYKDIMNMPV